MRCVIDVTQDGERIIAESLHRCDAPFSLQQIVYEVTADLEQGAEGKLGDYEDGIGQYSTSLIAVHFVLKLKITGIVGDVISAVVLDCNCTPSGPLSY